VCEDETVGELQEAETASDERSARDIEEGGEAEYGSVRLCPGAAICAICTGRTDPTHPRDPTDALSKAERIALVDPGYHPVFSLPEGGTFDNRKIFAENQRKSFATF
jgi:hypothetical protein